MGGVAGEGGRQSVKRNGEMRDLINRYWKEWKDRGANRKEN